MNPTPRKAWAGTFREAAAIMESHEQDYCCPAIEDAAIDYLDGCAMQDFFRRLFEPDHCEDILGWWSLRHGQARLLALLLAAEIAEREGR